MSKIDLTLMVYSGPSVYGMPSMNEIGNNLKITIVGDVRFRVGKIVELLTCSVKASLPEHAATTRHSLASV